MAEAKDSSAKLEAIIDRVTNLSLAGDAASVHAELSSARRDARADGNQKDELILTSLLATHLADAGEHERALAECLNAEALDPEGTSTRAATALQLFRMGRSDAAAAMGRELLASSELHGGERHLLLSMLGEVAVDEDLDKAKDYLRQALNVAVESDLQPMYWDLRFAGKLAARGDDTALDYLRTLQRRATTSGENLIASEVHKMLATLKS